MVYNTPQFIVFQFISPPPLSWLGQEVGPWQPVEALLPKEELGVQQALNSDYQTVSIIHLKIEEPDL